MKNYLELLDKIMAHGEDRMDRTGVGTRALFCEKLSWDLRKGFPIVTTKYVFLKPLVGELVAFIRGCDNSEEFRQLGCGFWDANANADYWLKNPNRKDLTGDLGRIYGVQWRDWRGVSRDGIIHQVDQLRNVLEQIKKDPFGRRHIVTAWNPGELDQMALPPCHILYQFFVAEGDYKKDEVTHEPKEAPFKYLDMMMVQRSCDAFLGVPYNISSYALLLCLVAEALDMKPRNLSIVFNDVHIYNNHFDQVKEQLKRTPFELPKLELNPFLDFDHFFEIEPGDIRLIGYQHHNHIAAKMNV